MSNALEIIVAARDAASQVLNNIGNAAQGLSGKLGGIGGGLQSFHDSAAFVEKIGQALGRAAEAAEHFATAVRTGKNVNEELENTAKDLPIVGGFVKAGLAISELITGEKAAKEEARLIAQAASEVAANFTKANTIIQQLGKHGFERQAAGIGGETKGKVAPLNDQISALQNDISERDEKFAKPLYLVTNGMRERLAEDKAKFKSLIAERDAIYKEGQEKENEVKRQEAESQVQFDRNLDNQIASSQAALQEKVLRREGRGVESAIVAAKERARAERDALKDSVSDFNLEQQGLSADEKTERRRKVAAAIEQIDKETNASVEELQADQARKLQEQAIDNTNNLNQIRAEGAIAGLQRQDEILNRGYELTGQSQRSHLAEAAQITIKYNEQIAEIEKKYREEHNSATVDFYDKSVSDQIQAAADRADQAQALLKQKASDEQQKNEIEHTKELRQAWQEVGDPADQYRVKLEEITEQYNKLHDAKLRDAQIQKLDKETIGNGGLFLLQQEAALGDKIAENQLKKVQIEKQYGEEKEKLLGIINSSAGKQEKDEARQLLGELDRTKKRALAMSSPHGGQAQLASLEESHTLRGVSAALGQEKSQFAPVTDAIKGIADLMIKLFGGSKDANPVHPPVLK